MALFEFKLANVELIRPWRDSGKEHLSWFALTDGTFHMNVGNQVLFQYSDELLSHWGESERDVGYQIASIARDILGSVNPICTRMPPFFEHLAGNWDLLTRLYEWAPAKASRDDEDVIYNAWRWLGERSPWTSYFVAHPNVQFVRIGDEVFIRWDNRGRIIEDKPAWSAHFGVFVLPFQQLLYEARSFADHLLQAMDERIQGIEAGSLRPQVDISTKELRIQHEVWRTEFTTYFTPRPPDVSWEEAEKAIRTIAERAEIPLGH
jgi:hypothetical protein